MSTSKSFHKLLTLLADLFFLWVLYYFGLGGWQSTVYLLTQLGPLPWVILAAAVFLVLRHSDYRFDVPIFLAGLGLGYWGEWWGTTRGVWTYWNGATPPLYLPPLWGIGVLTVARLAGLAAGKRDGSLPAWAKTGMAASFIALPALAFARSWPLLAAVDWNGRLDVHFFAGLLVAAALFLAGFDLRENFVLFMCGALLGFAYEFLGTRWGEWRYITGEAPPLWIAPLWGFAAVAMVRLARAVSKYGISRLQPLVKGRD
jgi:hypothetical protein